ncbi:DUF6891 domain-containing protein [Streptosporangium longisporum]|uniref:DUF6891 domain-containing protein n=1 Tax=Streptosporangium longisporum TaxID=46187 RepID=A0ABP6LCG7_9ACTN
MIDENARAYLAERIRMAVALGTLDHRGMVAGAVDSREKDEDPLAVAELAGRFADEELARHLREQRTWPAVTDCDRLAAAFRDLDLAGIVAREDHACCQTCGVAEIGAEVRAQEGARGYVFYHRQDAEHAAQGGDLFLAFGGTGGTGAAGTTAVGHDAVAVLRRHGFEADWSGDAEKRIRLPIVWRRRRRGRLAAHLGGSSSADARVRVRPLDAWSGGPYPATGEPAEVALLPLARFELPWLPTGVRLLLSADHGNELTLHRDWDRLRGVLRTADGTVTDVDVPRERASRALAALVAPPAFPASPELPAGERPAADPADPADPMAVEAEETVDLEVTFHRYGSRDGEVPVPMTLEECRDLLVRLPPRTENFAVFAARSGVIVQFAWQEGPRLWVESPDVAARCSRGRFVSLAEAGEMITILAWEGRSGLGELGGLETVRWS